MLCVDFPETVSYLSDDHAARQPDLDELFRIGQSHTDAEPIDDVQRVDDGVTAVIGDSVFTASKILDMPSLLAKLEVDDAPHGVVFGVPERSVILVHMVRDISSLTAIGQLAGIAAHLYGQAAYSVSPNIYHWHTSETAGTTVTGIGGLDAAEGSINIRPTPELLEVLNDAAE
ncbi:MAG: hypothetical protein QM658_13725 [Gordonia sp. (in: high G+C Gram-positive bacteria)]